MGVLLVHRMVGEDERQIAAASQTQRRSSEQERVVRVDDVGSEAVDQGRKRPGQWQDDGEVAAIEMLNGGNAHHVLFAFGHRSEEHTSELQSLMRPSYDDFCV